MGSVLAIIPAFNEEQNIEMVVEGLSRQHPQIDYVVINDGLHYFLSDGPIFTYSVICKLFNELNSVII